MSGIDPGRTVAPLLKRVLFHSGLLALARLARQRVRGVVLRYHALTEGAEQVLYAAPDICLPVDVFRLQMAFAARAYSVVPLDELVAALERGHKLPPRALAITFDDGYADNLEQARPCLAQHGLPATVFVTAGAVGATREFWWDELEGRLLDDRPLPSTLALEVAGVSHRWELGPAATAATVTREVQRAWKPWEDNHPSARHALYRNLYDQLFPLSTAERVAALDTIATWAQAPAGARPSHRSLTERELAELARDPVIEIGCHTMSHPPLATLAPAAQRDEIVQARTRLQAIAGRPIQSFAYPYGRRRDYDAGTVALVRELGFAGACSNFPGLAARGTDAFQVPRLQVRDWDGDTFARQLDTWLGGEVG
jgi:peptidoglycan/xylan/chitin deacetylase (PgdA/CDA1 family)